MKPEQLLQDLGTLVDAPNGIESMRQIVLNLAVRGKLVPQDPADEPASVLLEGRTIATPTEVPFKLPAGWEWTTLSRLGEVRGGGTPSKQNSAFWNGNIPWVSPKDMKHDFIGESIDSITEVAIEKSSAKLIPANSLLMVVRGMILAHSFPTALTTTRVTVNQDMKALLPFDSRLAPFLLLTTKGLKPLILDLVERSTHGTCRMPTASLFEALIPVAPLAEQHRIVAKVDALIQMIDELERTQASASELQSKYAESAKAALI